MAVVYIDTSCLVAIAFGEAKAHSVDRALGRYSRWISSTLLESEFLSAAAREGVVHRAGTYLNAVDWIAVEGRLDREIRAVLDRGWLRGADLWHVACALRVAGQAADLAFATLDGDQAKVARALGFNVVP